MTPQAKELQNIIDKLRKWGEYGQNRWKSPQLQKTKL